MDFGLLHFACQAKAIFTQKSCNVIVLLDFCRDTIYIITFTLVDKVLYSLSSSRSWNLCLLNY